MMDKKKNNILISLDESTKNTGYAVFDGEKLIDYGNIKQDSKNVLERVNNILNAISDLIDYYEPNNLAFENVQITMSAPTAKSLMGLQFAIELICYKRNIPYTLFRPTSWRKILGLSNSRNFTRKEKKQQTIDFIEQKYKINIGSDDVSDAIAIGTAYIENKKKEG